MLELRKKVKKKTFEQAENKNLIIKTYGKTWMVLHQGGI